MQISAANLLIAAGTPRAGATAPQAGDAFATALGRAKPASTPKPFSPPSLKSEGADPPPAPVSQPAPAAKTAAYGPAASPGANLDICV